MRMWSSAGAHFLLIAQIVDRLTVRNPNPKGVSDFRPKNRTIEQELVDHESLVVPLAISNPSFGPEAGSIGFPGLWCQNAHIVSPAEVGLSQSLLPSLSGILQSPGGSFWVARSVDTARVLRFSFDQM